MKKLLFFALLLFSNPALASGFETEADVQKFSAEFVSQLSQEKFQEAFNSAKLYWPLPEVEVDGLVNIINQQWPIVNQRFGKPTGVEFIRTEKAGGALLRYYYLHKFENHAIYWRLDFYKAQSLWKINNIQFLDDLDVLYK